MKMFNARATNLQGSGHIGVGSLTDTLLWFRIHTFPAFPQDHINLYVHQQSDDERDVEGHDGRVYHKGRIGNHAERLIAGCCGDGGGSQFCGHMTVGLELSFIL